MKNKKSTICNTIYLYVDSWMGVVRGGMHVTHMIQLGQLYDT